ncbi:MAG TPA: hypothetical protein VNS58_13380 [Puia sp.]|nr:hypothetical protein [Puia sp.]
MIDKKMDFGKDKYLSHDGNDVGRNSGNRETSGMGGSFVEGGRSGKVPARYAPGRKRLLQKMLKW